MSFKNGSEDRTCIVVDVQKVLILDFIGNCKSQEFLEFVSLTPGGKTVEIAADHFLQVRAAAETNKEIAAWLDAELAKETEVV